MRQRKPEPIVPVSRIHSPSEEIKLLKEQIQSERDLRKSLKIRIRPEYIESQQEHLEEQIKVFQEKLDTLLHAKDSFDEDIDSSFERQRAAERRISLLANRKLIEKLADVQRKVNELKEAGNFTDDQLDLLKDKLS